MALAENVQSAPKSPAPALSDNLASSQSLPPRPSQNSGHPSTDDSIMFRPPINRAMRTLDRSFFKKTVPLAAATVFETKNISPIKKDLLRSKDLLVKSRIMPVRLVQNPASEEDKKRKCLLLEEKVKVDDMSTWSPTIKQLVDAKSVEIAPYDLPLDYEYWTYHDIISSILPEEELDETPVGFSQVGHVAHLNLRDQYLPYRYLIAEILKDKNPTVKTVINKVDDVGASSQFRTFAYEHLAGVKDMNVIAHEQGCEFAFDFSKVYWNSRLGNEHSYLVGQFKEGEAVCDVMAGVGPFALPAGKNKIFVWANDLNPHGYERMVDGIQRNKVSDFVTPFNMDGREFIKYATKQLREKDPRVVKIYPKKKTQKQKAADQKQQNQDLMPPSPLKIKRSPSPPPETYICPPIFDHYVMNLPASAIEFVDAFNGVYAGQESLFHPHTNRRLPLIHVYCFSTSSEEGVIERADICKRLSENMGYEITPEDTKDGTGNTDIELEIRDVRLVAPKKKMFCASFRLPSEVAFKQN